MFVTQVTPLIRGTKLESLSYFSSIEYPIGSFVEVPIRGKTQTAIVTEIKPVSSTKTALKAATFSLRKLPNQPEAIVLPETIRKTAALLSKRYPASIGSLLFTLLPPDISNGSRSYPTSDIGTSHEETTPQILTAQAEDRFTSYQSFIRSTFAHRGSIMVIVPTAADIDAAVKRLSVGIEERLIVFSPSQTKRQRDASYQKLNDTTAAKLIITTPGFAFLERVDLIAIIVDQSASGHYVTKRRPYLDYRDAFIAYAKVSGRSILLGDAVHRTEDEVRRREEVYLTYDEEVKRLACPAPLSIVTQKDKPKPEQPFQLFSQELITSVERALENKGRVFFYAARRGLAPVVACIDCGHIFRCPDSNTPYSLMRTTKDGEEKRWFVSSTSGRRVAAADVCDQCGSWRLRERGIGIQQVADEWRKLYPKHNITILDNETAPTAKRAQKIVDGFYEQKSGILIGTQVALPYINRGVDVSAIISLDAARAIPTWRADEQLFRLIIKLREVSIKEVLVQSRTPSDNLLVYASRGALERFYDDEIALREMLQYPPYSTFILLTWLGNSQSVLKLEAPIKKALTEYNVQYYNDPNSTTAKTKRYGLIRISRDDATQYQEILPKLNALPPYVKIEINPERIV